MLVRRRRSGTPNHRKCCFIMGINNLREFVLTHVILAPGACGR